MRQRQPHAAKLHSPGLRESRIRRAMPRCATASPYSSRYPCVKQTTSATKLSRTAAISTVVLSSRVAGRTRFGSGGGPASAGATRPLRRDCDPRGAVIVRSELDRRGVKMRNLPEELETRVDLLARHRLKALGAETLDRQRIPSRRHRTSRCERPPGVSSGCDARKP